MARYRRHHYLIRCSVLMVCSPAASPPPSATAANLPGSSECTNRPSRESPGRLRSVPMPVMLARTCKEGSQEGGREGSVGRGEGGNNLQAGLGSQSADDCHVDTHLGGRGRGEG